MSKKTISRLFFGLVLSSSAVFVSCDPFGGGGPPADPDRPLTWIVAWGSSLGNEITGAPGSSWDEMEDIIEYETDYNIVHIYGAPIGNDDGLIWDNPTTFENFLNEYYIDVGVQESWSPEQNSFLLGINDPVGTDPYTYGFAYPLNWLETLPHGYAVSFVLKTKIHEIPGFTTEQKWRATQRAALHEMGHARGLVGGGISDFDHSFHGGENQSNCVMNNLTLTEPQAFCGRHIDILRDCLKVISSEYEITPPCTNWDP
jgi:hypothetical protein